MSIDQKFEAANYLSGLAVALGENCVTTTQTVNGFNVAAKNQGTRYRMITGEAFSLNGDGQVRVYLFTRSVPIRTPTNMQQSTPNFHIHLRMVGYTGQFNQAPSYEKIMETLGVDDLNIDTKPLQSKPKNPWD